ncbi:MAG: protein kinase [Myxococcales bacterium]|nr:protein kinase [Myxococcales bacterium]
MQARAASGEPCPDEGLLDAFASGQIAPGARLAVERHIDGCASCSRIVAELARLYGSSAPSVTVSDLPTVASARSAPPPPAVRTAPLLASVGRYRLIERLGEGGMGVVYVAHDPELDRRVALKLLRPEPNAATEQRRARLVLEAQAMAKLSHPNVVAVHDVGRVGEQLFLAMELVDGVTLTAWLAGDHRGERAVLPVLLAAGRGLAAAHGAGLVHRDFKPDNVLVGKDGRVRVTDFGLARASGPVAFDDQPLDVTGPTRPIAMTNTGMLIGTPAYMAPEQWRGEAADAKSDQFAFAITLYEALFGVRPFEGKTVRELATNVLAGRLRPFPSAPRWLRALLERALSLSPAARFPSMDALLEELGRDRGRPKRIAMSIGGMVAGAAALVTLFHFATSGASAPGTPLSRTATSADADDSVASPPSACEEARVTAMAVWSSERKERLLAKAPSTAKEVVRRLDERLGAAAALLGDASARACAKRNEPLDTARATCLAEQRRALEALAVVLDGVDYPGPQPYDALLSFTVGLAKPELCLGEPYLRARGSAFVIGDRAKTDLELDDAARLRVLAALRRWEEIEPIEKRLVEHAGATSLQIQGPGIVAQMLFAAGEYRAGRHHAEEASAYLEKAVLSARTAKDAELEARAAALLARVHVEDTFDLDEAERWLAIAESRTTAPSELGRVAADAAEVRGELEAARLEMVKAGKAYERAIDLRRVALGDEHPEVAMTRSRAVPAMVFLGQAARAEELSARDVRIVDAALGKETLFAAAVRRAWGEALIGAGKTTQAVEVLEDVREVQRDLSPIFTPDTALTYDLLARADLAALDFPGAETRVVLGEKQRENAPRREEKELAISRGLLADVLRASGDPKGAVAKRREVLSLLETQLGPEDGRLALARLPLARDLIAAGDEANAAKELELGAKRVAEVFGEKSARHATFLFEQGSLLSKKPGKVKEAATLLDDGWFALSTAWGSEHASMGPMIRVRAETADRMGDEETAKRLAGAALSQCESTLGAEHAETKRARALVDRLGR